MNKSIRKGNLFMMAKEVFEIYSYFAGIKVTIRR